MAAYVDWQETQAYSLQEPKAIVIKPRAYSAPR